jgi:hypothetical protein
MDTKKNAPKLKLSLKKETLRPLSDNELDSLDSVVGGTCFTSGCCLVTLRNSDELSQNAE